MNIEDLIIGKEYRVKSKKWFEENKTEGFQVVQGEAVFKDFHLCGKTVKIFEVGEKGYYHENDVEIGFKGEDGFWKNYSIPPFALEEDPADKRTVSQKTLDAIQKLKEENFIYGYDGGPGGGTGGTINTQNRRVMPAFTIEGEEGVYLKVGSCRRTFALERIDELFSKGKTEQSFRASEWTTITTELKLIEDKTKLPESSSWSTMRD